MSLKDIFRKKAEPNEPEVTEEEILFQKGNLLIILETFTAAYGERFKRNGGNPDSINTDDKLYDITNGDALTTSHMLIDIHEVLNIKMDYLPGDEYVEFPTVKDVLEYFLSRFDYRVNVENPHLLEEK